MSSVGQAAGGYFIRTNITNNVVGVSRETTNKNAVEAQLNQSPDTENMGGLQSDSNMGPSTQLINLNRFTLNDGAGKIVMRRTTSIVSEVKSGGKEMTMNRKHQSCVNLNEGYKPTGLNKFMSQRKSKPAIDLPKHTSLLSFEETLEKVDEITLKQDFQINN